ALDFVRSGRCEGGSPGGEDQLDPVRQAAPLDEIDGQVLAALPLPSSPLLYQTYVWRSRQNRRHVQHGPWIGSQRNRRATIAAGTRKFSVGRRKIMPERTAHARWQGDLRGGSGTMELGSGAFKGAYTFASRFENG